jgi:hypothetical protein
VVDDEALAAPHEVIDESDDDYAARRVLEGEASAQWAAEHKALTLSLWFVLRHSGREGAKWRVIFESRDEKEASDFFYGKLPRDPNKARCATVLTHGGTNLWTHHVTKDGLGPRHEGLGLDGTIKAAREREAREARRAKRGRKRISTPRGPEEAVPAGLLAYTAFRRQHPATRVEAEHYTHPLVPGEAFPSAKGATTRAYSFYLAQVRVETAAPRAPALRIVLVEEDGEELEADLETEAGARRKVQRIG